MEFSGKNGDPLFIALEKNSNENIKLYMVANTTINDNIKELSDLKNASFKYNGNEVYMPMSGSSSNVNIHSNQKGILTLQRCLTKVMVNAKGTSDFFQLKSIKIYNSPKEKDMNVFHQKITALSYDSTTENFYKEGFVDEENNKGIIYVPDFKWDETSKPYIIIGGEYTPKKNNGPSTTKYYKLEFVKRNIPITPLDHNSFVHIFELERNYAYIFNIDFLAEFAGYPTVAEAREKQATNLISRKDPIEIITFRNENIMDITTDNHVYLGVTSSQVTAELNTDKNYYTAQLHITTNNPKGWAIDDLPEGDYATCASWKPDSEDHVVSIQSTWIYLDCKKHKPNEIVKIFIYGGNIRKKIEITIRE